MKSRLYLQGRTFISIEFDRKGEETNRVASVKCTGAGERSQGEWVTKIKPFSRMKIYHGIGPGRLLLSFSWVANWINDSQLDNWTIEWICGFC